MKNHSAACAASAADTFSARRLSSWLVSFLEWCRRLPSYPPFRSLAALWLSGISWSDGPAASSAAGAILAAAFQHLASVRALSLVLCQDIDLLLAQVHHLPQLTTLFIALNVSSISRVSPSVLTGVLERCPKLACVHLMFRPQIAEQERATFRPLQVRFSRLILDGEQCTTPNCLRSLQYT